MVKTHHTHKHVTCPRCSTKFTAQHRPPVVRQQDSVPATKVNLARWLIALLTLALVLVGTATIIVYWYQQPQPSPAPVAKVQTSGDQDEANTVTPDIDNEEDSALEFVDDPVASPVLPSPSLPDLIVLQPVALDPSIPVMCPVVELKPLPVEPKPQQEPQPAPEQPPTTIQPFGGLTWDDDLLTAFQKTLALTESKSVTVAGSRVTDVRSLAIALKGLRTSPVLGIEKPVVIYRRLHLVGSPVIIGQGAFQIELVFIGEPGYALDHADKCLAQAKQIFGPEADCYFPLRLQYVQLTLQENTESRTLDAGTRIKIALQIYEQLKIKFADKKHFISKDEPCATIWQDLFKHKLRVYGSPDGASLAYELDPAGFSDLSQKLLKLQEEIKEKEHIEKFAKSEDRSNKL